MVLAFLLFYVSPCTSLKVPQYETANSGSPTVSISRNMYGENVYKPRELIKATGIGAIAYDIITGVADAFSTGTTVNLNAKGDYTPVTIALQKLQKDMRILDEVAGNTAQLTSLELALLTFTVLASAASPVLFSTKVVELLVPSMAALSAAVGISAEYTGKVAVSTGKEIAAAAIQAAAEAEGTLAGAERVKAILPLTVGIATSASAFSLLAPSLAIELKMRYGINFFNEIYLIMPIIAVLAASISSLATAESNSLAQRAVGIGNRRFASSGNVGRTWLSTSQQIEQAVKPYPNIYTVSLLNVISIMHRQKGAR